MIGVFDSGSGGLTVLRAIRDVLPSCDVVYFGDIAHAPYGDKPQEELSRLTAHSIHFLRERGAERIVSACNSVSASLALSLVDAFDIAPSSIIEMVGPTVASFRGSDLRVALCATSATVRSGIYQNAFRMIGKEIVAIPIPELAGAIEFGAPEEEVENLIRRALPASALADVDVLVLACTHYPLASDMFRREVPASVAIFDPALAVAERAKRLFWPQEVGNGTMRFCISKDSAQFRALVARLFPQGRYDVAVIE